MCGTAWKRAVLLLAAVAAQVCAVRLAAAQGLLGPGKPKDPPPAAARMQLPLTGQSLPLARQIPDAVSEEMPRQQVIDCILANSRTPMTIWVESGDGARAVQTTAKLSTADLAAMSDILKLAEAHDIGNPPFVWLCLRGVTAGRGCPAAVAAAGASLGLPEGSAFCVSFSTDDGICLVSRPGPKSALVWPIVDPPKTIVEQVPFSAAGVVRRDAAEQFVIRYDHFVDAGERKSVVVVKGWDVGAIKEIYPTVDLERRDVFFLVSTPTDRDQAVRKGSEIFAGSDSQIHARGVADAQPPTTLEAARKFLAAAKGRIRPPCMEVGNIPDISATAPKDAPLPEAKGDDPTNDVLRAGYAVPLDYAKAPFAWDYDVERTSVQLRDGILDLAGIRPSLSVGMTGKQPTSAPLRLTFLIRQESDGPDSAKNGGGPADTFFSFHLGMNEKRAQPAGKFSREEMLRHVTKEASGSRGPGGPSLPEEGFKPRVTMHAKSALPAGWCRVTVLLTADKRQVWVNGQPVRTWPEPKVGDSLPTGACLWSMQVSSPMGRVLISDIRVGR